jgi:hypothetical protein
MTDRLGALIHAPTKEGLLKSAGRMIAGQPQQAPQAMAPAPPAMPPRPPMAGPQRQVGRFVTGMPQVVQEEDPRKRMWG